MYLACKSCSRNRVDFRNVLYAEDTRRSDMLWKLACSFSQWFSLFIYSFPHFLPGGAPATAAWLTPNYAQTAFLFLVSSSSSHLLFYFMTSMIAWLAFQAWVRVSAEQARACRAEGSAHHHEWPCGTLVWSAHENKLPELRWDPAQHRTRRCDCEHTARADASRQQAAAKVLFACARVRWLVRSTWLRAAQIPGWVCGGVTSRVTWGLPKRDALRGRQGLWMWRCGRGIMLKRRQSLPCVPFEESESQSSPNRGWPISMQTACILFPWNNHQDIAPVIHL